MRGTLDPARLHTGRGGAPGRRAAMAPHKVRGAVAAAAAPPTPPPPPPESYVSLAHAVADAAAAVTTRYFRSAVPIDAKADASPVTVADREAEAAARALLAREVPGHAVYGEEGGMTPPRLREGGSNVGEYLWVIDPIDGTKSFITGKPLWGTLVALLHKGTPVLGIIDQPVTRERWVGVAGRRTTLNGGGISARPCPGGLGGAYVYATTPLMFGPPGSPTADAWDRVSTSAKVPLYGCDCYAYGLVAGGWADAVVEADLGPYDYLALAPIVAGAGGVMTDWRGRALGAAWDEEGGHSVEACPREVVAAGDPAVHAEVLAKIGWA